MANMLRTVIEGLPVELWLYLFENYFTLKELSFSFGDLNKRINDILNQASLYLVINSFPQKASEYKHNQSFPAIFDPVNVKSLKINSLHFVEEFLALNRFAAFSQLRSVYINNAFVNKTTYMKLLDQLAFLKYLQSLSIAIRTFHNTEIYFYSIDEEKMATVELTDIFLRSIFLQQNIPSLKFLQLHEDVTHFPLLSCSLPKVSPLTMKLEHLTINRLSFDILIKLTPYLQQVKSVRIGYLTISNDNIVLCTVNSQMAKASIEQLPNCVYFHAAVELKSDIRQFEHIEFLLKILPGVEKLHLKGFPISILHIPSWTLVVPKFCPKLLTLTLGFVNRFPFKQEAENMQKTLRNSSFWHDRQVKTMYDERRSSVRLNVEFDLNVNNV